MSVASHLSIHCQKFPQGSSEKFIEKMQRTTYSKAISGAKGPRDRIQSTQSLSRSDGRMAIAQGGRKHEIPHDDTQSRTNILQYNIAG